MVIKDVFDATELKQISEAAGEFVQRYCYVTSRSLSLSRTPLSRWPLLLEDARDSGERGMMGRIRGKGRDFPRLRIQHLRFNN